MTTVELKDVIEIIDDYIKDCEEQVDTCRRNLYGSQSQSVEYGIDTARSLELALVRKENAVWLRNEIVEELGE